MLHPEPIESPLVSYIVLGLAILFEGAAWLFALKEFRRGSGKRNMIRAVQEGKDPSSFVVLFEDSAALLGLLVALIGISLSLTTGLAWFDGLASVIIGLILGGTAIWLAYETKGLLIGESAQPEVVRGIRQIAMERPRVRAVNEVLTMHMGPHFILVNLSVDFDDQTRAGDLERVIAELDRTIKDRYPNVKRVFIEAEADSQAVAPAP